MTSAFVSAATLDEALSALAGGARPVAGGTDLVVGARQGKAPLPESLVAIHRLDELRGAQLGGGDGCASARSSRTRRSRPTSVVRERLTALADASAIVGSHATQGPGHDRRQRHERLAGDGARRAADRPRRDGGAPLGLGRAAGRRWPSS